MKANIPTKVLKYINKTKDRRKARYKYARDLGLPSKVAMFLQSYSEEQIKKVAEQYNIQTENKESLPTPPKESGQKGQKPFSKPENVDAQIWADFLSLRRAKKLPVTRTALEAIQTEADKLKWSLERTLKECVARNWGGFKASWIEKDAQKQSISETMRAWKESQQNVTHK